MLSSGIITSAQQPAWCSVGERGVKEGRCDLNTVSLWNTHTHPYLWFFCPFTLYCIDMPRVRLTSEQLYWCMDLTHLWVQTLTWATWRGSSFLLGSWRGQTPVEQPQCSFCSVKGTDFLQPYGGGHDWESALSFTNNSLWKLSMLSLGSDSNYSNDKLSFLKNHR